MKKLIPSWLMIIFAMFTTTFVLAGDKAFNGQLIILYAFLAGLFGVRVIVEPPRFFL